MNIIFFNNPVGTKKLNFVISNKSIQLLKKETVIPMDSATLVKPYNKDMSDNEKAILVHINKTEFDNYNNPTAVIFDMDLIKMFFLDIYRSARSEIFSILDILQMRAMLSGKQDIVKQIEIDKQILRDLPTEAQYKLKDLDCFFKVNKAVPRELLVDYKEKYEYLLK
jgi:hypothetical protein